MANLASRADFPLRYWQLSCYIIIALIGIFGNSLVLVVLKKNKKIRESAFGVYIGSLAVADIIVSAICVPVYVTSTSALRSHPTGVAGDILCKLWTGYFALFYFAVISIYTLVAISFERYLVICHPLKARYHSTPTRAYKVVIFIWICSIIPNFATIGGLKSTKTGEGSFGAHCTSIDFVGHHVILWKVFYVIVLMIEFILPISGMLYFFVRINKTLKLHIGRSQRHGNTTRVQTAQLSAIQKRKKSVQTVIAMILCYFSCWSLNQVLYFMVNIGYGYPYNENLTQVSVVLCCFSSCINPIIYAFRSQLFRKGFAELAFPFLHSKQRVEIEKLANDIAQGQSETTF
eukprot:Seg4056.2 transcript_id=Seg4056.2/GoldUCD/mRNA.D3Y31 product="Kappa-type opioid receptor" protein_id=Seg4056.2/GoldUCD/D3Y31